MKLLNNFQHIWKIFIRYWSRLFKNFKIPPQQTNYRIEKSAKNHVVGCKQIFIIEIFLYYYILVVRCPHPSENRSRLSFYFWIASFEKIFDFVSRVTNPSTKFSTMAWVTFSPTKSWFRFHVSKLLYVMGHICLISSHCRKH